MLVFVLLYAAKPRQYTLDCRITGFAYKTEQRQKKQQQHLYVYITFTWGFFWFCATLLFDKCVCLNSDITLTAVRHYNSCHLEINTPKSPWWQKKSTKCRLDASLFGITTTTWKFVYMNIDFKNNNIIKKHRNPKKKIHTPPRRQGIFTTCHWNLTFQILVVFGEI